MEFSSTYKDGPLSIRIPRDSAWDYKSPAFEFGKWKEIEKGNDTLILAVGSMVKEVVNIAEELKTRGISPTIVGVSSVRPLDEKYIEENVVDCCISSVKSVCFFACSSVLCGRIFMQAQTTTYCCLKTESPNRRSPKRQGLSF